VTAGHRREVQVHFVINTRDLVSPLFVFNFSSPSSRHGTIKVVSFSGPFDERVLQRGDPCGPGLKIKFL
jgi:hypothetical protein